MDKILDNIIKQDYNAITANIEKLLLEQIKQANSTGCVLGLSGGIDSAVLAYICKRIIKQNTLALIMPDTAITPKSETEDALKIVDSLGIDYKLIDIKPIVNEYSKYLEPNEKAVGNLRARVRTNILYYYANVKNLLVLGSSDKSEYLIGYFTKYGDGAADITPIISLYKLQVRKLAEYLGVSKNIVLKKSSPHLWKDHEAEKEIGLTYEEIDSILYCLIDKKMSKDEICSELKINESIVERIIQMMKKSEHKRDAQARPNGVQN